MQDFDDSTLWRISEFERVRLLTGNSGYAKLGGPTVLPTTLVSELARLEYSESGTDAMEVIAACMRHREPALILRAAQGTCVADHRVSARTPVPLAARHHV